MQVYLCAEDDADIVPFLGEMEQLFVVGTAEHHVGVTATGAPADQNPFSAPPAGTQFSSAELLPEEMPSYGLNLPESDLMRQIAAMNDGNWNWFAQ